MNQDLAQEIADALGDWQVSDDQPTSNVRLDGPAGAGLYLRTPYWEKGRVVVGACWPAADVNGKHETFQPYFSSYGPNPTKAPRITCAISRGAEAIAKDIVRRFLPQYLPLYEQQAERMAATLADAANKREIVDQLNAAGWMQGRVSLAESPPSITFGDYFNKHPEVKLTVHTYEGLRFDAEIRHLNQEQAEAIIRLLIKEGE